MLAKVSPQYHFGFRFVLVHLGKLRGLLCKLIVNNITGINQIGCLDFT